MKTGMTCGEAIHDPSTNIYRMAKQTSEARQRRLEMARELVARDGITLEEACQIVVDREIFGVTAPEQVVESAPTWDSIWDDYYAGRIDDDELAAELHAYNARQVQS